MGVDMGGANTAQVLSYCNQRRGSDVGMVFATRGQGGPIPIWPPRSSLSKARRRETFYNIGVDTAKELIYSRLATDPPEPGYRKAGYIHFPLGAENFDNEYFEQLAAERQVRAKRSGQDILTWEKIRERNEALDTMVIPLAVRRRWGKLVGRAIRIRKQSPCRNRSSRRHLRRKLPAPMKPSSSKRCCSSIPS
jgi:terminase, large subunit